MLLCRPNSTAASTTSDTLFLTRKGAIKALRIADERDFYRLRCERLQAELGTCLSTVQVADSIIVKVPVITRQETALRQRNRELELKNENLRARVAIQWATVIVSVLALIANVATN